MGERRQFTMWIAAAAVAVCALLGVLVWEQSRKPVPRALYLVGDPQRGKALFYGEKRCSTCHSIDGNGSTAAPDLSRERPGTPAMGWLAAKFWDHSPAMSRQIRSSLPYPKMTREEMADMLAFLFQASSAGHPGDAAAGEKVFREKGCASCHAGGGAAPNLSNLALATSNDWMRSMWNHTYSMLGPVTTALGRWPEFHGEEMSDLAAYLAQANPPGAKHDASGDAARGWAVFQEQCLVCHSVAGHGGGAGPALGPERDLPLNTAEFAGVLWNHAPSMHKRAGGPKTVLKGNEMADLTAFLASLRYVEPAGSRFVGERLFAERGCAYCHGPRAEGNQFGPRLGAEGDAYTLVSFTAALWKHGPKMVDQVQAMHISWPSLEPSDIGNLIAFLNGPRP